MKNNFVVHVVNPIQTDSWRHFTKIRPHKTDKIDSLIIADFIRYGEYSETSLASEEILNLLSSPADFENISAETLNLLLDKVTLKKFTETKLKRLSNLVKNSFGISFGLQSLKIRLHLLIAQFSFIEGQVVNVELKISELLDKLNSTITTIPGKR